MECASVILASKLLRITDQKYSLSLVVGAYQSVAESCMI